jgi:hypothetical protein
MIDDGRISWAINVASARSRRPEVRVPMRCIISALKGEPAEDMQPDDLAAALFGGRVALIPAPRVYMGLSITHGHLYELVREGSICLAPGCEPRRGINGVGMVRFSDASDFLAKRRVI